MAMADPTITPGAKAPKPLPTLPNPLIVTLSYIGEVSILLGQALRELRRGRIDRRDLIDQMQAIGVSSIPIAILTAFSTGAVIALYFTPFLQQYNVGAFAGGFVGLAVSRELVPVLTGVVVAARAGSAIAAEIGTMKVTEQIDALRALAVSPIEYLVVPRLVASVVMLPVVCAIADAMGLFGGFLISTYLAGEPAAAFPNSLHQFLEPSDFYLGLVKTLVFGLILALVGCHQGLNTRGGANEVGQATRNTVVISIVLIYISNFFLTYVMFSRPIAL